MKCTPFYPTTFKCCNGGISTNKAGKGRQGPCAKPVCRKRNFKGNTDA